MKALKLLCLIWDLFGFSFTCDNILIWRIYLLLTLTAFQTPRSANVSTSIQEWWPKLTMNRRCCLLTLWLSSLGCRHNGRDGVSNHQHHDCLLNRLFWCRSRKTSKLRVTGLCVGNSPGTGEFPAQMASNAENVSFWWRLHVPREPGPVLICDKMSYHKIVRSY